MRALPAPGAVGLVLSATLVGSLGTSCARLAASPMLCTPIQASGGLRRRGSVQQQGTTVFAARGQGAVRARESPAAYQGLVHAGMVGAGTGLAAGIRSTRWITAPRRLNRLSMSVQPGDLSGSQTDVLPFADDREYISYAERLAHSFTANSQSEEDGGRGKGRPCFGFFTETGRWRWATYAQVGRQVRHLVEFLKWGSHPDPGNGIVGNKSTSQKRLDMSANGPGNADDFQWPEPGTVPLVVLCKRSDALWYALDFAAQLAGYAVVGIDTHASHQTLQQLLAKFKPSTIVYDASTEDKVHRAMEAIYTLDTGADHDELGGNGKVRLVYAGTAGTEKVPAGRAPGLQVSGEGRSSVPAGSAPFELELAAWRACIPRSLWVHTDIDWIPQQFLVPDDSEPATLGGGYEALDLWLRRDPGHCLSQRFHDSYPFFGSVLHARRPDALCRVILTSGSSGLPKGAALGDCAWTRRTSPIFSFDSLDVAPDFERSWVSMQPATHILDLKQVSETILRGGRVGFRHSPFDCAGSDSTRPLWDTFLETRPTYLTAVPAIWRQVQQEHAELAADVGEERAGEVVRKNILGGSLKKAAVVGAKPDAELLRFVRTVVKKISSPGSDRSSPRKSRAPDRYASTEAHTVLSSGKVDFRNKVKVKILPSEKSSAESEGELLVQSPNLFLGYFGDPDATADAFWTDPETGKRWYRTGDLAKVDASGKYAIVGRARDSVKMADGEFVNSLSTENKYWEKMGEELQRDIEFLKINLRPGEDGVVPMIVLRDSKTSSDPTAAKSDLLDRFVTQLRASENFERGEAFGSFEFPPKEILAIPRADFEQWREWGLMTGTGKPVSHQIAKRYEKQLDAIYEGSKREKAAAIGSPEQIAVMKRHIAIGTAEAASTDQRRMALIAHVALALELSSAEALLQEANKDPLANLSLLGLNSLNAARLVKPISEIVNMQHRNAGTPGAKLTPPMILAATVNDVVGWLNADNGAVSVDSPAISQMLNDMQPTAELHRLVEEKRVKKFELTALPEGAPEEVLGPTGKTGVFDLFVPKVLNVFVTGGTGAVAAVVVDELLKLQLKHIGVEVQVTCLVRGDSDEAAKTRLLNQIASVRGTKDQDFPRRLSVVRGNITQENFGLSKQEFTQLAQDADVILHSSAAVNHVQPYSWHRESNTVATQRVLEFAASAGKDCFTPLHFISSSNAISGHPPMGDWLASLPNGYMQSKCVSEMLCRNAIKLLAAVDYGCSASAFPLNDALTVYRPGILTSHRQTGFCKLDDLYPRLLMAMRSLKIYPTVPDTARYDMTPNDIFAKTTAALLVMKTILSGIAFDVEMVAEGIQYGNDWKVRYSDYTGETAELYEFVLKALFNSEDLACMGPSILNSVASDTFDPISRGVEVPFKCLVDGVKLSLAEEGANLEQVSFDLFVEHIRKSAEVGANEDARRLLPLVHEIRRRGRPRAYEAATRQTRFEAANSCSALVTEPGRIAQQSQITPKTIQKCIDFCLLSEKIKDGP